MITLTRVDNTRLYQAEHSLEPGFLTYYVSAVPQPELPPLLTVDDAWSNPGLVGYFLILSREPANIQNFAAAVAEHGFGVPQHASFAWVQYEESTLRLSVTFQLDLETDDSSNVVIATGTVFRFGNYGIPFMQNGLVKAVGADAGIQEFSFQYPLAYPPDGPPNVPPDLPPAEGTGVNMPLLGPQRYVLRSLALVGDFSSDTIQGLDVGLRYFYAQQGKVVSQFYPIFESSSGRLIEFHLNWDPLAPLNSDRSWMKFTGNAYQVTITAEGQGTITVATNGNVLPSWLRTIYGKPLWLRPILAGEHAARLVLQRMPGEKSGEVAFYMVPEGDYELLAEETAHDTNALESLNLLCGLAGTESIAFTPGTFAAPKTTIRFHPFMPAFSPGYPLTGPSSGFASSAALLDYTWTTAWASVAPSAGFTNTKTVYYAQPEQAALYNAKPAAPPNVLELFESPVAEFDHSNLDESFPLAIYAGVTIDPVAGFSAEDVRNFELQILNPSRKENILQFGSTPAPPVPPPPVTGTTPQGLVTQIEGAEWKSVLLANDEVGNRLEFIDVGNDLRAALQSNQLFLVASLAEPLGNFQNHITIAGWPFDINVGQGGQGGDYRNVLIFKFGRGAIKDLVTNPQAWTSASVFNQDPELMSLFLQNYILSAETSAEENYRFKSFVNLVSNPAWEGILALQVTVAPSGFPDDLKGLLAGIDLERFAAHHFGIETSFVQANGTLQQDQSSLFGLISYVDRDYVTKQNIQAYYSTDQLITHVPATVEALDPATEFYDFKVLQLEVVFQNSELLDFTSRIQLTTTRWFSEPATLESGYPPDPIDNQSIDLLGSYEVHDGQPSYSFYTDPYQTYKFLISSQVLNYVQIVKARFETARTDPQSDGSERIFTRFSFWGYLNFKEQPTFDLFSFGGEVNEEVSEKQGLYFSNLGITMDFTLLANETTENRVFAFDAGRASYDLSQSQVRLNSLFNRFPLTVTSILQSNGRGSPADLGYLPVRTPKDFKALRLVKEEWYALNCELNLGSMGALAAKAGFSAALLLAWSPSEQDVRAEVQIKLPGTGGGKKLLSIQGVLKLSIQYFEFTTSILANTNAVQYQLSFRNAGLSLVGMKLPTTGNINVVLGGDPDRLLDPGSLSWYAAYYRDNKTTPTMSLIEG